MTQVDPGRYPADSVMEVVGDRSLGDAMADGVDTPRLAWLSNRTRLTVAIAVAGVLVLGGGAASAAVVTQQMAAAERAEQERVAAAAEHEAVLAEHSGLVADGNALVKDLRAALVAGASLLDQATIDEAARVVEYLALALAATQPAQTTTDGEDENDALATAIADARAARDTVSSLAITAAEARLAAASLAGEQIRQKVVSAVSALAAARDGGGGVADALTGLVAALKAAEASHQAALDAQNTEKPADPGTKPPTKPQPDKPEKQEPVDKTGWYTAEEAAQAVITAWGAVPWYEGCVTVGEGYWYRSGGSPSSPPAPPAVAGVLGFKVEIVNAEKAWVWYYDCP